MALTRRAALAGLAGAVLTGLDLSRVPVAAAPAVPAGPRPATRLDRYVRRYPSRPVRRTAPEGVWSSMPGGLHQTDWKIPQPLRVRAWGEATDGGYVLTRLEVTPPVGVDGQLLDATVVASPVDVGRAPGVSWSVPGYVRAGLC